jgi:hypothetical protein
VTEAVEEQAARSSQRRDEALGIAVVAAQVDASERIPISAQIHDPGRHAPPFQRHLAHNAAASYTCVDVSDLFSYGSLDYDHPSDRRRRVSLSGAWSSFMRGRRATHP